MHIVVVGAAPAEGRDDFYRTLLAAADHIVAADAAGEWCVALGSAPALVVGDFDSAEPGASDRLEQAGVSVELHSPEKDSTDLDLALDAALRLGATHITATRVLGGRTDHALAAIGSLVHAGRSVPVTIDEPLTTAWVLASETPRTLAITACRGALLTLLAISPTEGVTTTGLRYPLVGARLSPLASLGISNVVLDDSATIAIDSGALLIVCPHSDAPAGGERGATRHALHATWYDPGSLP